MSKFLPGDRVQFNEEPTDWNLGTVKDTDIATKIVRVKWDEGNTTHTPEGVLFLVNRPGRDDYYKTAFDITPAVADPVEHPAHYQHPSGIEVIQITRFETFLRGNIVKYVLRAPYKGDELEDLRKARQYLDWEIERVEGAKVLVGNSDAAIANRAEILGLVTNYQTRLTECAAGGASRDALKSRSNELKQEFIDRATGLGFPHDGVLKYAAAFDDFDLAIDRVPRELSGIGVAA